MLLSAHFKNSITKHLAILTLYVFYLLFHLLYFQMGLFVFKIGLLEIALLTMTSSSKFFGVKFNIVDGTLNNSAKQQFFNLKLCVYHFLFGSYRLYWYFFSNQQTKSIEKHKLFRGIAPKQVKIDMPFKNQNP